MTVKLSRLIKYLQNIENIYGDMEVEVNNIGDSDDFVLSNLCVVNDKSYDDLRLLLEIEKEDPTFIPALNVYEYPSNKEISLL